MAAPLGNENAKKGRDWADAIKRALARRGEGDYYRGLNMLAEKLLDKADAADMAALRELGDRIDGKPHQSLSAEVQGGLTINLPPADAAL
jgi:hypothetical protein